MTTKLPRLPFVLLGAMTVVCLGGPLAIGYVLQGGASPDWPPDRPVEWVTFVGISGTVFLLMMACLTLAIPNRKAIKHARPSAANSEKSGAEP